MWTSLKQLVLFDEIVLSSRLLDAVQWVTVCWIAHVAGARVHVLNTIARTTLNMPIMAMRSWLQFNVRSLLTTGVWRLFLQSYVERLFNEFTLTHFGVVLLAGCSGSLTESWLSIGWLIWQLTEMHLVDSCNAVNHLAYSMFARLSSARCCKCCYWQRTCGEVSDVLLGWVSAWTGHR